MPTKPKQKQMRPVDAAQSDDHMDALGNALKNLLDTSGSVFAYSATTSRVPDGGIAVVLDHASTGRAVVSALLIVGESISSDMLRAVPLAAIENSANLSNAGGRQKLDDIRDLPPLERADLTSAEFSELVARHYLAWASAVPNPIAAMTREHGIPTPTMNGWIREARLRGLLPPARIRRKK